MSINLDTLQEQGLRKMVANCQLLQESACTIVDLKAPELPALQKAITDRAFIPFGLDIIGEYEKKAEYIGEFSAIFADSR